MVPCLVTYIIAVRDVWTMIDDMVTCHAVPRRYFVLFLGHCFADCVINCGSLVSADVVFSFYWHLHVSLVTSGNNTPMLLRSIDLMYQVQDSSSLSSSSSPSLLACITGVCSSTRSQRPPEWPGLRHVDCLSRSELLGLDAIQDCLCPSNPRMTSQSLPLFQ